MRILMTTTRGAGHFGPLRTFADAFRRAGHHAAATISHGGAASVRGAPASALPPVDAATEVLRGRVTSA